VTDIVEKWGTLVAQRGFAQVPNHLLLLNTFLDDDHRLSSTELLVLIQIVGTWWKTGDLPFPSMTTLAARCGVSSRQIQRSIDRLEKLGFIQRVKRRNKGIVASNAYDLEPLAKLLTHVAKAFPNPYPRSVNREAIKEINEQIGTSSSKATTS
jgi:DNA-binding transcriptional regulator YhcF (GntR family)